MRIAVVASPTEVGSLAAQVVERVLRAGASVLGVATGSTFVPVYEQLARVHERDPFDTSRLHFVLLDEYVGLPATHPNRYGNEIVRLIADPLGVPPDRVLAPDVDASNLESACRSYETLLRELGGADLQLLGLGRNGHIGFNEPGSSPTSRTRLVHLTPSTIDANRRFFECIEPPSAVITQGIATILESKQVLLVATGHGKREAVRRFLTGSLDLDLPATALWLHPNATAVLDRESARDHDG